MQDIEGKIFFGIIAILFILSLLGVLWAMFNENLSLREILNSIRSSCLKFYLGGRLKNEGGDKKI